MWIDKAATFALAHELGGDALVDLMVEQTHTCYLADRSRRHAWGYGCGAVPRLPACERKDLQMEGSTMSSARSKRSATSPPAPSPRCC